MSSDITTELGESFASLGRSGAASWWRYLVGSVVTIVLFFTGNIVSILFLVAANGGKMIQIDKTTGHMLGVGANIQFVALGISFFFLLVPLLLVVRFLHKRPWLSLITASHSLNFSSK